MPINAVKPFVFDPSVLFQDPYSAKEPTQTIADCFEKRHVPQSVQYEFVSLKELYEQKDSLKNLNASQIIHFWNNLGAPKTGFFDVFNSKKPEEYLSEIIPKLCDEITDRFITGRGLKSDGLHLLCILNNKLKSHIIRQIFKNDDKVLERYAKAKQSGIQLTWTEEALLILPYVFDKAEKTIDRYQEAKRLNINIDPCFALDLFRSRNVDDICNFFMQVRQKGIEYQHLFLMPKSGHNFLHQLFEEKIHPYKSIAMFTIIAMESGIDIQVLLNQKNLAGQTPMQYAKDPLLFKDVLDGLLRYSEEKKYNELLKEFRVDPELSILHSYKQLLGKVLPSHGLYQFFINFDFTSFQLKKIDLSIFSNSELINNPALLKFYLNIRPSGDGRIHELYEEADRINLTDALALMKPHLPEITPAVEYNRILKTIGIMKELHFEKGKDLDTMKRGYRRATLHLHPDKTGPIGEIKFKRFVNLAEQLGIR